jgi:predicted Zn-dependent protease
MLPRALPLLALAWVVSCAGVGSESILIPDETEKQLGAEFHKQLLLEMPPYQGDPAVAAYVTALGNALVPSTDRPDLACTFTVVDADEINAFAVLGGYVYVTRGLLASAKRARS